MKKIILLSIIFIFLISSLFAGDIASQLNRLSQKLSIIDQPDSQKVLSLYNGHQAPYTILYEHTGLYQWQLFPQCYYEYDIDTVASVIDIDIEYDPNDDLFSTIPAYFNLWTRRPYSGSLADYKSYMVSIFKSLGTGVIILTDRAATVYGYSGYEYCQSFYYDGTKLVVYARFLKVDDIVCTVFYMAGSVFYNNPIYKIFFDLILSVLDFKPFTGVSKKESIKLFSFSLSQNYPNPFNASTVIGYSVAEPSRIKLELFNIKGELVQTVFHRFHNSGNYSINLNAAALPSGPYLYRLSNGQNFQVQRMILIK